MAKKILSDEERMRIIDEPYISQNQAALFIGTSSTTMGKLLRKHESKIEHYDEIGWNTEDIIDVFHMRKFVNRKTKSLAIASKQ